jgi:flagellar export protein FliJ
VPRFRFRAQAALDLRRRELDAAQRELARAERDRDAARRRLADADASRQRAADEAAGKMRGVTQASELQWYQSWILRLDHERRTYAAMLTAREAAVSVAAQACIYAKRRCESLERLREKGLAAHDGAEAAAERKLIDELATRRYAAGRMEGA